MRPLLRSCRSRPVGTLGGLACVHVQGLQAVLTAHGTAPVEFTLTLGHPGDMGCVIASPTTHDFAAVHASGSQVAHTACCAQGARLSVPDTVVWRVLKIHEVVFRWLLKSLVGYSEAGAVLVHDHLDGPVVLPPEIVACLPEVSHGQPARPQSTRATHAMTLALLFQEALYSLPSSSVVVKIHQGSGILAPPLLGIDKRTGEFDPVVDIVTAATPVEGAFAVLGTSFLLWITGTGL